MSWDMRTRTPDLWEYVRSDALYIDDYICRMGESTDKPLNWYLVSQIDLTERSLGWAWIKVVTSDGFAWWRHAPHEIIRRALPD